MFERPECGVSIDVEEERGEETLAAPAEEWRPLKESAGTPTGRRPREALLEEPDDGEGPEAEAPEEPLKNLRSGVMGKAEAAAAEEKPR